MGARESALWVDAWGLSSSAAQAACVARSDVAVEDQAKFGVGGPSEELHRCISRRRGRQQPAGL